MKSTKQKHKWSTRETMEQLEVKTDPENKLKNVFGIVKGVIVFVLVTLSLFHVFFEPTSDLIVINDNSYDLIIRKRNRLKTKYLEDLKNRKLTVDEYYASLTLLISTSKKQIDKLNKEKRQIKLDHSFLGRNSFHFWIFVFGLVTALFFFSCKSLHDDFARGSTFRFHFVSLTGIMVSGFWFIHLIFLTQKDFSQNKYVIAILLGAALFSAFTYFLVKYYTYKDDIIYRQLSFIEKIRRTHYPRMAEKAMYAKKTGLVTASDIHGDIDEFQEDLREVINHI